MDDLIRYLKRYCEMLRCEGKIVSAVSIGFPATLDKNRRMVLPGTEHSFYGEPSCRGCLGARFRASGID